MREASGEGKHGGLVHSAHSFVRVCAGGVPFNTMIYYTCSVLLVVLATHLSCPSCPSCLSCEYRARAARQGGGGWGLPEEEMVEVGGALC